MRLESGYACCDTYAAGCTTCKWEVYEKFQAPQLAMTVKMKNSRYGADSPVMSQAGAVPGPKPRLGPTFTTRGQHPRSRYVKVKQRKRIKERKTSKKPDQQKKAPKQQQSCLNILQVNISAISDKKIELAHLFSKKNIHVALVQESRHHSKDVDPHITNYTYTTCDHQKDECQGVLTYIRNDITGVVENIESDSPTDLQKISIWYQGSKYTLYNIYNPPWNNITFNAFSETNYQRTIVAGDFNGHSPEWGYTNYNKTGKAIEEFCESTNLTILQDENSPQPFYSKSIRKNIDQI